MSLSPFDSFQSQFVTYLLHRPRINAVCNHECTCWIVKRERQWASSSVSIVTTIQTWQLKELGLTSCRCKDFWDGLWCL